MFNKTQELSRHVLATTSSPGCSRIHEELQSLTDGFQKLQSQVDQGKILLNDGLKHWAVFEENRDAMSDWLTTNWKTLEDKPELKPTLAEKEGFLEDQQVN